VRGTAKNAKRGTPTTTLTTEITEGTEENVRKKFASLCALRDLCG
jgi:hypothetical protein